MLTEDVLTQDIDPEAILNYILELADEKDQRDFLRKQYHHLNSDEQDLLAQSLKTQSGQLLRANIQKCLKLADLLIFLSELTGNAKHGALGLLAKANAHCIGLGDYQVAINFYDEAIELYRLNNCAIEQATSHIGRIYALASLNRTQEAFQTGWQASQVLRANEAWFPLAKLMGNMAVMYLRLGEDQQALELFDVAQSLYLRKEVGYLPGWSRAEYNRATILRNLGNFDASIKASQQAYALLEEHGQTVEAAKARQNLAITYYVLGRYNESLALLDSVRDTFLTDGRHRDAILAELFISNCLLELRRFQDVLEKCNKVRTLFSEIGASFEVGQAILNEAIAYTGLRQFDSALNSLSEARHLFKINKNRIWETTTILETAVIHYQNKNYEECLAVATSCAQIFVQQALPDHQTQALVVAAQAAVALNQVIKAQALLNEALSYTLKQDVPSISYQAYYLLGQVEIEKGNPQGALENFDKSIAELERVQGRLMVEYRSDFLSDKQAIYTDIVRLSLDLEQPLLSLQYAERAKSRALLNMLAFRLDLGIQARDEEDQPIVQNLKQLMVKRDKLYRHWESGELTKEDEDSNKVLKQKQAQQDLFTIEKQITELWHKLQIRNAAYARDASLWQVRTESVQPLLKSDTLLIEYFVANDELIIFLVTNQNIFTVRVPTLKHIQTLLNFLRLNMGAVPQTPSKRMLGMAVNARGLLQQMYQHLIAPITDIVKSYKQLIIVPHGTLHYVPFHALYDGRKYLIEQFDVSYLPSASFLQYCQQDKHAATKMLSIGHSYNDKLPHTILEAQTVATQFQGKILLEEAVTKANLKRLAADSDIIHLATHGDFRPDNPLFSGLKLADGWLTTLDIFNWRLRAALVTLSACQTGKNVVGGGDELLGLMRAFLSVGVSSLVLSFWPVEDQATSRLMRVFYQKLAEGLSKNASLRFAQCQFISEDNDTHLAYQHPYYWASFFLVGNTMPL